VLDDTFAADITGLLDLQEWTGKIPGRRIILRDEPLHPRYRKRATEREKELGRRCQLIATNVPSLDYGLAVIKGPTLSLP
jgi:hypothetical protein